MQAGVLPPKQRCFPQRSMLPQPAPEQRSASHMYTTALLFNYHCGVDCHNLICRASFIRLLRFACMRQRHPGHPGHQGTEIDHRLPLTLKNKSFDDNFRVQNTFKWDGGP
jgi:hypothetical protein